MTTAAASARVLRALPRLGELTAGRDNNLQLLRLAAAAAVLLFHCYALTDHWTDEPLWHLTHELNLGALGVEMFFLISGFLVTQSWLAHGRLLPFATARALRIYPALCAATLLSAVLAAWSSNAPAPQFWRHPQVLDYVLHTALGYDVRHLLPGAYAANPMPAAANGSLYTLSYELRLYVAVALAGVCGGLARRFTVLALCAAGAALALAWPQWPDLVFAGNPGARMGTLVLMFALGALACVWRDAIPLSRVAALVAMLLVGLDPAGLARAFLFAPLLAYAMLTIAYHPAWRWPAFNRAGDYSYGLYLYAFPIQQTLVERIPGLPPLPLFALALPATLALAILSWHALERPALGLKSRFARPATVP